MVNAMFLPPRLLLWCSFIPLQGAPGCSYPPRATLPKTPQAIREIHFRNLCRRPDFGFVLLGPADASSIANHQAFKSISEASMSN